MASWKKVGTFEGSGTYRSPDGRFEAERDVRGGQSDDPEALWFLYDNGELIEYFPTLREAKSYAEALT